MKKLLVILKWFIYYLIGLVSFSIIAFITQMIIISILFETTINPSQDMHNISVYINAYGPYYLTAFTILYLFILYSVRKYDRYIVNKLNEKLERIKGEEKNGKR